MPTDPDAADRYAHYAAQFDPDADGQTSRHARRRPPAVPQREPEEFDAEPRTANGDALRTTYRPARFEAGWLIAARRAFFDEHLITDVLGSIKGGKEASVYRCAAHASTSEPFLAAKVYRI